MRPTRHRGVGVSKQVDETSKTCAVQQAFVVQTRLSRRGGVAGGSTCGTCSTRQPVLPSTHPRPPAVHWAAGGQLPGSHVGPQLKLANLHQEGLVPPASGHVLQAWRGREKQQAHAWNKPASSRRCDAEGGGEGQAVARVGSAHAVARQGSTHAAPRRLPLQAACEAESQPRQAAHLGVELVVALHRAARRGQRAGCRAEGGGTGKRCVKVRWRLQEARSWSCGSGRAPLMRHGIPACCCCHPRLHGSLRLASRHVGLPLNTEDHLSPTKTTDSHLRCPHSPDWYVKLSPGASSGCWPTTPRPRTSWLSPCPLVMFQ